MKRIHVPGAFPAILFAALTVAAGCALAAGDTQSIGYEMKVQRASEVAIWAIPAVSIYDIELSIQRDLGGQFGDVVYFTKPMESRHGFLTANDVTPYVVSPQSTKDGPLVVEVPPASEKVSFFGTFVDGWQTPIADVGPPGDDKGKGGKYLFLPPGYEGKVPQGYLVYRPLTYGVHLVLWFISSVTYFFTPLLAARRKRFPSWRGVLQGRGA